MFSGLNQKIARFMQGRHGGDQLGVALLVLCGVLLLFSYVFRWPILNNLAFLVMIYAAFRILSRKTNQRYQENAVFLKFFFKLKTSILNLGCCLSFSKEKRGYRYFSCPRCVQRIRVPKGKGKIRVTCPKCGEVFEKKS